MVHLYFKVILTIFSVKHYVCQKDYSKKGRRLSSEMFKYREIPDAYEDTRGYEGNEDALDYEDYQDYQGNYEDYLVQDYFISPCSMQDRIKRRNNKYVPFNSLTFSEGKVSNNHIKVHDSVTEGNVEATSPWWKKIKKRKTTLKPFWKKANQKKSKTKPKTKPTTRPTTKPTKRTTIEKLTTW